MLWILEVLPEGLEFAGTCQNSAVVIWSCLVMHVTTLYIHAVFFFIINFLIFIPLTSQLDSSETVHDVFKKPHLILMPLNVV